MAQLNGKSPVTWLAATVCPVKVRYYHKNPFFLCAVKYKLATLPMGCCPRGSNVLCVTDFPTVKLPWENFHGYVKKNKKIPMTDPNVGSMG